MTKIGYNLITLAAFLIAGISEFLIRDGAGFTLTAFVFYGVYHLAINIMYLIQLNEENNKR
jgi:succinate-acetate transporter protein